MIGTAFYLMDYVEGRLFWDATLPEVAGDARRAIYDEMTRVIAALHSVDYAAVGLGDYGKPGRYIERQVARWSQQYRASETETIDAVERLIEWLPKHIPADEETGIVHGDFRLDNAIFHPKRAAYPGGAGLGVVDIGASARRSGVSLHALPFVGGSIPRSCRIGPGGIADSERG